MSKSCVTCGQRAHSDTCIESLKRAIEQLEKDKKQTLLSSIQLAISEATTIVRACHRNFPPGNFNARLKMEKIIGELGVLQKLVSER